VTRAAFFDRDGVVNELVRDPATGFFESPLVPGDVVLKPGVAGALKRLRNAGYLLIGISNQPAAAKGSVNLEQLRSVQARVEDLLQAEQLEADAFRLCFHHPEGVIAELALVCDCRKPAPGMLLAAASELDIDLARSWMIGDTDSDVAAGAAAGCRTVLVEDLASSHKRSGGSKPDARAPDLDGAVECILGRIDR
jgi:D-glycero-D-manno-heptose 1,7-bisphosphate phosphatase